MTFEEYKTAFERILELSEILENLCKKNKIDEIDEIFNEQQELFSQLSLPKGLSSEEISYILELRDKIKEKNDFILRFMQTTRNKLKQELTSINTENKIINAYKIPKGETNSSIFDSKE